MGRKSKRSISIDGKEYIVSVNEEYLVDMTKGISINIYPKFGKRGLCQIIGLTNQWYYVTDPPNTTNHIQLTPGRLAKLVGYAMATGWDPENSGSTYTIEFTNDDFLREIEE